MEQPGLPPDLLHRYLTGRCTEAERRRVDAWYEALDRATPQPLAFDERRSFERLRARITDDPDFGQPRVRPLWQRPWVYLGGAAAAAVLVAGLLLGPKTPNPTPETAAVARPVDVSFQNQSKKITPQRLPDGSTVWLHPGASLTFARSADGARREVRFSGEAFFDVFRDPAHPFLIRSGRMTTQVLGTSFNVKADPASARYEVAVLTGKVAVRTSGERPTTVLLTPQQRAVFDLPTDRLTKAPVPDRPGDRAAWQPASLAFDDATLDEVARRLEATFDVRIRLGNPALRNCRLKVDFTEQQLPEILDMLGKLLGTDYTWEAGTVTLTGSGCGE